MGAEHKGRAAQGIRPLGGLPPGLYGLANETLDHPEQKGFHVLPVELAAGCARQRVEPNESLRQELGLEPFGQERLQPIGIGGRVQVDRVAGHQPR